MSYDSENHRSGNSKPMSMGKAVGWLLLLYVLIAGSAVWRIREICLLRRDDCDFHGLLETVLSERLVIIGSALLLGLLVFITVRVFARARDGTLGVVEEPPGRKFNVNGVWVSLAVFLLYLGGAAVFLMYGAVDPSQIEPDNVNTFVLGTLGPMYGCAIVFFVLWHANDYFLRPASTLVLILLFAMTFGSVYLMIKSSILIP